MSEPMDENTQTEGTGTPGSAQPEQATAGNVATPPAQTASDPAPATPTPAAPAAQVSEPQLAFPPSHAAVTYTDLTVEMRYHPQDGLYYIGVVVNGAFIPVSCSKAGYVDEELREAATPGYKADKLRTYQLETLGLA